MFSHPKSTSASRRVPFLDPPRVRTRGARSHRTRTDDGVTLIEVLVAFVVLMVALVPLSYLFTTALVSAGQSDNQQTATSIAERWVEILSNTTPPVNAYGEVVVDTQNYPQGPAPSTATTTAAGTSVGKALSAVSSITVTSASNLQPVTGGVPQTVVVTTGTSTLVTTSVSYSSISGNVLTCASSPCSSSTGVMSSSANDPITQSTIVTPTETRGGTSYTLKAKYSWATAQNSGAGGTPDLCTAGTPQLLKLTMSVSWGPNADANNVQDSILLNYPPAGIQTLGFIALQMSGDSTAYDTQSPSAAWSSRVQAIPVTIAGTQNLPVLYPDSYGCVFAQVQPGTYTVAVGQPSNGFPSGTTYGSPSFVANATGTVTGHVWSPPTSEPQPATVPLPSVTVAIGAVTKVQTALHGDYPGFDQASTVNLTYPSSTATEDGVSCPGAGQITCISSGENASGTAVVNWANGGTWSSATLPASVTRVESLACAGTTACIGVGFGPSGAVILSSPTGASHAISADSGAAIPAGSGAALNQVVCPTSSQCVAIGTSASGAGVVLSGTISGGGDTWTQDTLTNATTSLTSLVCPATATGCAAIGTTASGGAPIIVTGPSGTGTWAAGTATGFTLTTLTQVLCPTATSCMAIGTGKVGSATTASPIVLSGVAGGGGLAGSVAWTADTEPGTTLTSLTQIICPLTTKCLVIGNGTSSAKTGALVLYGTPAGPLAAEFPLDSGATVPSLTQIACPSATACIAIGTSGTTPEIFTGTVNATATSADTWAKDSVTSSGGTIATPTQVVCPGATSCLLMASGTSTVGTPQGFLLSTSDASTWTTISLPAVDVPLYFDDIDCNSAATTTCAAVGSSATGAVITSTTGGPTGSWSDQTPSGLSGYTTTGVPIETNNSGLSPTNLVNVVTAGASTNVTQLPTLYPFPGGYPLWAGDCLAEQNSYNISQATTIPGGISGLTSGMPSPTIPLGLLALQVNHQSGANAGTPYVGATLTIKVPANANGCGTDTYTLQTAGADGLSRTEVPYGTYNLYINGSSTSSGSVTVAGGSVTVGAASAVLPNPVTVSA